MELSYILVISCYKFNKYILDNNAMKNCTVIRNIKIINPKKYDSDQQQKQIHGINFYSFTL